MTGNKLHHVVLFCRRCLTNLVIQMFDAMKWKYYHCEDIFVTSWIGSIQIDNFQSKPMTKMLSKWHFCFSFWLCLIMPLFKVPYARDIWIPRAIHISICISRVEISMYISRVEMTNVLSDIENLEILRKICIEAKSTHICRKKIEVLKYISMYLLYLRVAIYIFNIYNISVQKHSQIWKKTK